MPDILILLRAEHDVTAAVSLDSFLDEQQFNVLWLDLKVNLDEVWRCEGT